MLILMFGMFFVGLRCHLHHRSQLALHAAVASRRSTWSVKKLDKSEVCEAHLLAEGWRTGVFGELETTTIGSNGQKKAFVPETAK